MTALESTETTLARMRALLDAQQAAHLRDGPPAASIRKARIDRCITLLVDHKEEIVEAVTADFGARSPVPTRMAELAGTIAPLKHAKANLDRWMRPEKPKPQFPLGLLGARAEVLFQPKGVVGVIAPWNFPVHLALAPLAGVFAAGNRTILKLSELTPTTSELLRRLVDAYFEEEQAAVVTGGPEIGAAFAALPFDHLMFTGGTGVGRRVMMAAAENLTPVTLELGGKNPAIVGRSADLRKSAARIMTGKILNAGQICLSPDYALVLGGRQAELVDALMAAAAQLYPTIKDNPDYSAIIDERNFARLKGMLEDARAKGATIIEINPAQEDFSQQEHRKLPPTLVLSPRDDMLLMQEEIFGPILPVKSASTAAEAVAYVNAKPHPLALYYFGEDGGERDQILARTRSGGLTINDVVFHNAQEDLPFGGIGASGIGAYHGRDGFLEFSHRRAVYKQIGGEMLAMMRPPYGEKFKKQVEARIAR
jgi:coniferyl-aldehyde dehydrogenase